MIRPSSDISRGSWLIASCLPQHLSLWTWVHTIRYTRLVGILWTSGQLIADAAVYTTHNKTQRTFVPSVGFEATILAIKRLQTYALDCAAAGISGLMLEWFSLGTAHL
jgi:hypothetical protein